MKHIVRGAAVESLSASLAARARELDARLHADIARTKARHAEDRSALVREANSLGAALPTMSPVKMRAATSAIKGKTK